MEQEIDLFAYEALRALALTHNYNQWIYEIFKPYLGTQILEVGCGIGNLSRYFIKSCQRLFGVDTSVSFLNHLKIDYPEMELHNFDITDDKVLVLEGKKINTVVCVNVLEHIENENKAIDNMFRLLVPNGYLLLFVPALKCIYGALDMSVNHFRRYDKASLKNKIETAGFDIEKIFYNNFLGIFGWFVNGKLLKRKKFPILQPLLFDKLVPFLSTVERLVKPPVGMSLIVIARKPG